MEARPGCTSRSSPSAWTPPTTSGVYERNAADDTFGFGVVFSDETLEGIEAADPETFAELAPQFARWAEIDVHYKGEVVTSGGHGFSALSRRAMLDALQQRAAALGVQLRFNAEADPRDSRTPTWSSAPTASTARCARRHEAAFRPSLDPRRSKYMWLGTELVFDAFKFFIAETEHGVFQVHGYPYGNTMSTFIVETSEETWRRAGLDRTGALAPGESDAAGIAFCEELFADALDGHRLIGNHSRWINFVTVRNAAWHHENVVLLGDAAHTAHFSIGSGTKLALEDAIGLAWALREHPGDLRAALEAYEADRRPIVESTQRAAQGSLEWFEGIARYVSQPPVLFAFNLLTRSRRITYGELQLRDPGFVEEVDAAFDRRPPPADVHAVPPARARARQPRRGLADGHVLLARRHARRLPPRPPRRARDRRRRAGDDGDDLRLARGADHARLRRPLRGRAHGRVGADRRLRARQRRRPDRRPARPLGPQGLDEADVGGRGRAAARRQLAADRARRRCRTCPAPARSRAR